jgi:putative peptidoglycan binding protein
MILSGHYEAATGCTGSSRPGAKALMSFALARYPGMANGGIYACRKIAGSSAWSVHAEGRADDIMTGTGQPTEASRFLAEQLHVFSAELGVCGLIHNRQWWFSNIGGAGWNPYNGSNPHTNHIHVEILREWANRTDMATRCRRVLIGPSVNGSITGARLVLGQPAPPGEVREIQARLVAHGWPLAVDGIYGPITRAAVTRFQTLAGIEPDGIVGPITRGRLR